MKRDLNESLESNFSMTGSVRNFFLVVIVVCFVFPLDVRAGEESSVVDWDSSEGRARLLRSVANEAFFSLADRFQPQRNPVYCGVASSVIVLNAIRQNGGLESNREIEMRAPADLGGKTIEFPAYSQENFLNESTEGVKRRGVVEFREREMGTDGKTGSYNPGFMLDELAKVLEVYKLDVKARHATGESGADLVQFRQDVIENLSSKNQFVICNFYGEVFGRDMKGHFSPLGAYDVESDSVLVMDVAGFKNGWYWVPVKDLYAAMNTLDGSVYRGWLVIHPGEG